jgi:RNA polymerase sigma-70 factor (ECF subfamily)
VATATELANLPPGLSHQRGGSVDEVTEFGRSTAPPSFGPGPLAKAADEERMRHAFVAHQAELHGLARRVLGSTHLAEDAVQETFVRAWRSRERFDSSRGSLRTWLFSIERNLLIDMARTRARAEIHNARSGPMTEAVDDGVEKAMDSWQVEEAILGLSSEHRAVIVEMYFRGQNSKEVATRMAIPEGTVRSRLFYALKALRANLDAAGWQE